MRFRDDERAVTVQIGAILLFATIIIALSLYQATVVPSQNADVEYKHSQTVQNQLSDVRNAILRTAGSGNTQPVSVSLGTQYPSRVFLMNPPPATGTIRTGAYENGTVQLSNVDASNFSEVVVTFDNLAYSRSGIEETSSSQPTGSVSYSLPFAVGDDYTITIDVVNDEGLIVDSVTVTDTADGTDP